MPQTYDELKQSFSDYLSRPSWDWSWYVTQTFDPKRWKDYPRLAEHSWRFFLNMLSREAMMTYGFVFAEPHRNGRMHWHALVHVRENLIGQPRQKSSWEAMEAKYGYCQIETYCRSQRLRPEDEVGSAIARYLSKYVVKEASRDQAWWDFSGNISGSDADTQQIMSAIGAPMSASEAPFGG